MVEKGTYSKPNKLHSAGAEAEPRDSRKYYDKSDRIPIKLETDRLWEEHRAHERALRCREPYRGSNLSHLYFGYSHEPVRVTSPKEGLSKGLSVCPTDFRMRTTFVPA
jgi:hypothetical protein